MMAILNHRETQFGQGEIGIREDWKSRFEEKLAFQFPGIQILGKASKRLWNTTSVIMPGHDCQFRWVVKLDKAGVSASTGSACASGKEDPSHVLLSMGHSPEEISRALRFSSSLETEENDWEKLLEALVQIQKDQERA